jgi:hypothetical protein
MVWLDHTAQLGKRMGAQLLKFWGSLVSLSTYLAEQVLNKRANTVLVYLTRDYMACE